MLMTLAAGKTNFSTFRNFNLVARTQQVLLNLFGSGQVPQSFCCVMVYYMQGSGFVYWSHYS